MNDLILANDEALVLAALEAARTQLPPSMLSELAQVATSNLPENT